MFAGHEGVQLWESGPYWATANIGAENPWDYGCYFWWGGTVGYRRMGSKWAAGDGSSSNFSFDGSNMPTLRRNIMLKIGGWLTLLGGVLAPRHDAAHTQWGCGWRMPTKREFEDLESKCDWTWTKVKNVQGYVVRGRGDYASARIFLPSAGFGGRTSLHDAGSRGYYWSSIPSSDSYYEAYVLEFNSESHSTSDFYYRYSGQSVRPVQGFTE